MRTTPIILIFCFFLRSFVCLGQNTIDSLETRLKNTALSDSDRVITLITLASKYGDADTTKTFKYNLDALELAKKLDSRKLMGKAAGNTGYWYYETDNYKKAIEYFSLSIEFLENNTDTESFVFKRFGHSKMGEAYTQLGIYELALKHFIESEKITEKYLNSEDIEDLYGNISTVLYLQKKYPLTKKYLDMSLSRNLAQKDTINLAVDYLSVGNLFLVEEKYDSAIFYYLKSAELKQSFGDSVEIAGIYTNISFSYLKQSKIALALQYVLDAIEINKKHQNPVIEAETLLTLGRIKRVTKEFTEAINLQNRAIEISKEYGLTDIRKDSYEENSLTYERLNDYKNALVAFKKFSELDDSLLNVENTRHLNDLQVSYELEKKEAENVTLQKDKELQTFQIQKFKSNKFILLSMLFFVVLGLSIFAFLYSKESKTNYKLDKQIQTYQNSAKQINELFERNRVNDNSIAGLKLSVDDDINIFKQYLKASLDLIEKSQKSNETVKVKRIRNDIQKHITRILTSVDLHYQNPNKNISSELEKLLTSLQQPYTPDFSWYRRFQIFLLLNIFSFLALVCLITILGWNVMEQWVYICSAALFIYDLIFIVRPSQKV